MQILRTLIILRNAAYTFFHEGIGTISVDYIAQTVKKHIDATGKKPLVVIDYLQILALNANNERLTDKQCMDKTVLGLKQVSRDFSIPVFAISSFNRQSYTAPADLASFKESGAIEYSADVLLGMQYAGMDYETGDTDAAREKRVRLLRREQEEKAKRPGVFQQIELKILKFRNGKKTTVPLELCPMCNCFRTDKAALLEKSILDKVDGR